MVEQNNSQLCLPSCAFVHMFAFSKSLWDSQSQLLVFIRLPLLPGFLKKRQFCLTTSQLWKCCFVWSMRETLLSDISRSSYTVTPCSASPDSQDKNSCVDYDSVALCTFCGPCPPCAGLTGSHSHSCHSRVRYGNWPLLSCLIQKRTWAKGNRLGVYFSSLVVVFYFHTHIWVQSACFAVIKCVCACVCVWLHLMTCLLSAPRQRYSSEGNCAAKQQFPAWRSDPGGAGSVQGQLVCFSPASLSSHFFPKSKAGSGRGRAGLAWPQHKRQDGRQTMQGGIQVMDVGSLQRGVMGNMLT